MAAQLQGVQEKAFLRAMKFFNDPHDVIVDPDMREIVIKKNVSMQRCMDGLATFSFIYVCFLFVFFYYEIM